MAKIYRALQKLWFEPYVHYVGHSVEKNIGLTKLAYSLKIENPKTNEKHKVI